mmetsp:Transcript_80490/g.248300  ORF Transcript_80490/g.248300 Transcript_80490/m.248300 type:complete len:215 (-) Transcript_80490:27-671(-)
MPWKRHELSSGIFRSCAPPASPPPAPAPPAPPGAAAEEPGRGPSHAPQIVAVPGFSRVHAGQSHGSEARMPATPLAGAGLAAEEGAPPAAVAAGSGAGAGAAAGAGAKAAVEEACVAGAPVACRTVAVSPLFTSPPKAAPGSAVQSDGGKPSSTSTSPSTSEKAVAASRRRSPNVEAASRLAVCCFPAGPRNRRRSAMLGRLEVVTGWVHSAAK